MNVSHNPPSYPTSPLRSASAGTTLCRRAGLSFMWHAPPSQQSRRSRNPCCMIVTDEPQNKCRRHHGRSPNGEVREAKNTVVQGMIGLDFRLMRVRRSACHAYKGTTGDDKYLGTFLDGSTFTIKLPICLTYYSHRCHYWLKPHTSTRHCSNKDHCWTPSQPLHVSSRSQYATTTS